MGNIKDIHGIFKDTISGKVHKTKVKNLIDNMILSIETNTTTDDFYWKYHKLNDMVSMIKWKERDKQYKEKYIKIKRYYQEHWKKKVYIW